MQQQDEPNFADTPEGADLLELIEAIKEGSRMIVDMITTFPDRFDDPRLKDEAEIVSKTALDEFMGVMKAAAEKRVANRRQ